MERLGVMNDDDEIYYSHTKQKELAELAQCTFKPNINQNTNSKRKDLNTTNRTETTEAIFNRLHEVKNTKI